MGARAGEGVGATRLGFCRGNRELLRDQEQAEQAEQLGDVPTAVLSLLLEGVSVCLCAGMLLPEPP